MAEGPGEEALQDFVDAMKAVADTVDMVGRIRQRTGNPPLLVEADVALRKALDKMWSFWEQNLQSGRQIMPTGDDHEAELPQLPDSTADGGIPDAGIERLAMAVWRDSWSRLLHRYGGDWATVSDRQKSERRKDAETLMRQVSIAGYRLVCVRCGKEMGTCRCPAVPMRVAPADPDARFMPPKVWTTSGCTLADDR